MKNSEAYRRYTILVSEVPTYRQLAFIDWIFGFEARGEGKGGRVRGCSKGEHPLPCRLPLYSRKLHMRVRRASTSCVTSLTILALSLGDSVVNHLARRWMDAVSQLRCKGRRRRMPPLTTLPWRDSRIRYLCGTSALGSDAVQLMQQRTGWPLWECHHLIPRDDAREERGGRERLWASTWIGVNSCFQSNFAWLVTSGSCGCGPFFSAPESLPIITAAHL
jgi:hypothetical protein